MTFDRDEAGPAETSPPPVVALIGNPNVGKTTLFNAVAGVRQKTANFPGTTQEAHVARIARADGGVLTLVDLPGIYGLGLDSGESRVCRDVLERGADLAGEGVGAVDRVVLVLDATNLRRNLALASEVLALGLPTAVVVTMTEDAERRGIGVDPGALAERFGCAVELARKGFGRAEVLAAIDAATAPRADRSRAGEERDRWIDDTYASAVSRRPSVRHSVWTDRIDAVCLHPVGGPVVFALTMTILFWVIFSLATYPMDWIDALFAHVGGWLAGVLPEGAIRELLVEGVVAGVGATVIFLPQIVLLFLLIALLEHSGYLARAAFVVDRALRPFGLPGHAFVPLLSGHACALPGIMAARAIPDRRERLATILVLPFMSCTARIPVYALLTTLLFPGRPGMQAVAFTGCYVLGIVAGLVSALIARRTLLKGAAAGMVLELPRYRPPDIIGAVRTAAERGWVFLRKAGTVILGISIVLWWLGTYPQSGPSPEGEASRVLAQTQPAAQAEETLGEADRVDAAYAARRTALGRLGSTMRPVFAPLGADEQLTIGILASFAAREVFVTTMAVQVVGDAEADFEDRGVLDRLASAERAGGGRVFDPATSWALLVYFVLAMQCLPTLAVTAREAGGWKWAGIQLAWMTGLAYTLAAATFAVASAVGG
jgi:ferrous iron transport protein B